MKTFRSLVALLALAAIVVPSTGSVAAAEVKGRQPAMKSAAPAKKSAAPTMESATPAKKAVGKAEARAKKSKGDKPLKAGKNDGGRKKAA